MKKIGVLFIFAILILSLLSFAIAQEMPDPTAGLKNPVLDESGLHPESINTTISPYKSKLEKTVETINVYTGPISSLLFGVSLSLSWDFAFTLTLWIIIFSVAYSPLKIAFKMTTLLALLASAIIATISMRGFGKQVVSQTRMVFSVWWTALLAIIIAGFIFLVIYPIVLKKLKENVQKQVEARDKETLHRNAQRESEAEKDLAKDTRKQ